MTLDIDDFIAKARDEGTVSIIMKRYKAVVLADEIERLRAMVQDEARWQPIAASYRDERDALRAAVLEHYEVIFSSQHGHEESAVKLHAVAFPTSVSDAGQADG